MEQYWSRFAHQFDEKESYVVGCELVHLIKTKLGAEQRLGRLLELGCGNGVYTGSVIGSANEIVATDYSASMVEAARAVFAKEPRVRVEQADCFETGYVACSFDTVLAANLIHIIPTPERMLREALRVIRPGGRLLCTCFTTEGMHIIDKLLLLYRHRRTFGPFPQGRTLFTSKSLARMVEAEGGSVDEAALVGNKTKSVFLRAGKK